ncbi:MAG TPA: hypothetical protein VFJ17_07865 [Mycobacteriales bacterium]|jgi:hypothetical protein|nr:hypothetical protein [Mycobacteriales bacterium]
MKRTIVRASVIGTAVATVAAFGVASAAWDASNAGAAANSNAKSKGVSAVVVNASTPASAQLYPGAAGDLTFTVANNNPFKVQVTGFSSGSAGVTGITSDATNCTGSATGLSYTLATAQSTLPASPASGQVAPFDLAANGGTVTVTLVGAVSMDNSSANACSGGVTYTVPIAVTAASDAGGSTAASTGAISVGR